MSKKVRLGEIASFQTGPFGTQFRASEYSIMGTPVINVKNIGYGNLILNDLDYVPDSVCSRLSNHLLKEGDIVFGRKGSVDRHCYIKEENDNWMQGSDCIRVRLSNEVNARYISYYLMLDRVKKQINNASIGSTMASINTDILKTVEIVLPCLEKQNLIVDVLSKIDEKIENNNRVNSELESMAKTIYDYWFLQFDFPDENGRPYKSSGGKMVWNEELKREIPEGWRVGNLYDIADFVNGLACQKFRPVSGDKKLPVVKIAEMHDGITSSTEFVRDDISEKNIISDGDILFSWSATLETMIWTGGKAGLNQHIFKVIPKNYTKYYVYMQLSAYIINFVKMAETRKTTMGHITTDHIKQSKIILPPKNIVLRYSDIVDDVFSKIIFNNEGNREMTSMRDFLLPLLMNGQVGFKK